MALDKGLDDLSETTSFDLEPGVQDKSNKIKL